MHLEWYLNDAEFLEADDLCHYMCMNVIVIPKGIHKWI